MYVRVQYNPQPKCAGDRMDTVQLLTNRDCSNYKLGRAAGLIVF